MKIKNMIKRTAIGILAAEVLFMSVNISVFAEEGQEGETPSGIAYEDLGTAVEQFTEENSYASFETIIFRGDEILYTGYFGYADKENGILADENTVYEWGSVSKTMVWVSVLQLYEQGKLDLNEDIRNYLPDGFFKRLKYDDPITMLDLMNHKAGWQETMYMIETPDADKIMSLEEALRYSEPRQVFRPGEVSAYSNWGAALAGFIVERISGESYCDYVHHHILEPLGMEHTSIGPDHSDTPWVQEQREKLQVYQIAEENGEKICQPIGTQLSYIMPYPAGAVTGTIADMAVYAQAFVDDDTPLFEHQETLELMLSGSDFYGETDIAKASYGLWPDYYAVDILGHAGSTNGGTANLVFDPESKLGCVALANEPGTSALCGKIPRLIYGDIMDNPHLQSEEITVRNDISGVYIQSRGFLEGPLECLSLLVLLPVNQVSEDEYMIAGMISARRIGNDLYLCDQMGNKYLVGYSVSSDGKKLISLASMDLVENHLAAIERILLIAYVATAAIGFILLLIKLVKRILKKYKKYDGSKAVTVAQIAKIVSCIDLVVLIGLFEGGSGLTHLQAILTGSVQILCAAAYMNSEFMSIKALASKSETMAKTAVYLLNLIGNIIGVAGIIILELYQF